MFCDLLDAQKQILGEEHQECLEIRSALARSIEDQHRYGEAEQMYQELLKVDEQALGMDHPTTLNVLQGRARVIAAQAPR